MVDQETDQNHMDGTSVLLFAHPLNGLIFQFYGRQQFLHEYFSLGQKIKSHSCLNVCSDWLGFILCRVNYYFFHSLLPCYRLLFFFHSLPCIQTNHYGRKIKLLFKNHEDFFHSKYMNNRAYALELMILESV